MSFEFAAQSMVAKRRRNDAHRSFCLVGTI
jgi:hypothetical protein